MNWPPRYTAPPDPVEPLTPEEQEARDDAAIAAEEQRRDDVIAWGEQLGENEEVTWDLPRTPSARERR